MVTAGFLSTERGYFMNSSSANDMSAVEELPDSLDAARALVAGYDPEEDPAQNAAKESILALLAQGPRVLSRAHTEPGHITASSWIQSPCGEYVLLCFHRKLNRWLQLGGHVDGESDLLGAALREAQEESDIAAFDLVVPGIFDLDIHPIPPRGSEPAHTHFDVRFLLRARSHEIVCSAESLDLRWVNEASIGSLTTEASILRMAEKARRVACR